MKIMAPARQWPTVEIATLGELPPPDAELVEEICADGITEPLYITGVLAGKPQIQDGRRRAAAAQAAGLTAVPYTPRPVIRVDVLTAHPANARKSARAPRAMVTSIAAEGVSIPVKITRDGQGWRIIDGHVRVDGARQAGRTHVPYEVDERDEASQRLDMVTTARHRQGLTLAEEASALFSAAELGADLGRITAAAGLKNQKQAKRMIKAGSSKTAVRAASRYDLTMDQMAALADLAEQGRDAAKRVEEAMATGARNIDFLIQRETAALKREATIAAHRAALTKAGAKIVAADDLGPKAVPVADIPGISATRHEAQCQGHVWVLADDADQYAPWCKNTVLYGHAEAIEAKKAAKAVAAGGTPTDAETPQEKAARKARLAAVKAGNLDWDAATGVRRAFLAKVCTGKVSRARLDAMTRIVTMALSRPWFAADRLTAIGGKEITAEILGIKADADLSELVEKSGPARLPVIQFAILAGGAEAKARRQAWRTDDQHNQDCRVPVAMWFRWLCDLLGYQPEAIEAAVRDDQPYDPAAAAQGATGDQPAATLTETPGAAEQADPAPAGVEEAPTPEGAEQAAAEEHQDDEQAEEPAAEDEAEPDPAPAS